MSPVDSPRRIADRLIAARRARFVGREPELELFRSAIVCAEPTLAVFHVWGPGGVGKTTLVQQFACIAQDAGRRVVRVDARNIEPTPEGLLATLLQVLGVAAGSAAALFSRWPGNAVLTIDTYEAFASLDQWLREQFLPQLPAQTLVVIAGRQPPAVAWTTDIAWAPLTRVIQLGHLRPEEGHAYLSLRGIPPTRQTEILAATFGHPLALSLAADAFAGTEDSGTFEIAKHPDVVRVLLEKFVQGVPTAQHRLALYGCAFTAAMSEDLLAAALGVDDAHEIFEWLRGLSFIESGPYGLLPHDLSREVLYLDSRWRSPEVRRGLNERLLDRLYRWFQQASGVEQQRLWFDIVYLQRYNAALRPYLAWGMIGSTFAQPAQPSDAEPILGIVEQHEGAASREIARYWLRRQPQAFLAFRNAVGEMIGFMAHVRLEHATEDDLRMDPAVRCALTFIEHHGPTRPGEGIVHLRFWMTRDDYQQPSPAMNVLAANSSLYWTTHPELAWSFFACSDPDRLAPALISLHVWRSPEADFQVGERSYGVFAHDWRIEPITAWMRTKVDRATYCDEPAPAHAMPTLLVLSQSDFGEAVRQALRDYTRLDRLVDNPLIRTRLLADQDGAGAKAEQLRTLLAEAANSLQGHPKDQKLYLALKHTFLEPAATQEQAAELLGLPFNTYRYRLTHAIERVTGWLLSRELNGGPGRQAAERP